ncbi:Retinoblastoma-Like Protein 1 [Manis pentadactyla]|nr:Retinoblastoma-Like Protein 1 [Manis pentadactyla]
MEASTMPFPSFWYESEEREKHSDLNSTMCQAFYSCQVGVAVNAEDSGQPRCSQVLSGLTITAVLRGKRIEVIAQMLEDSEEKAYRCCGPRGRKAMRKGCSIRELLSAYCWLGPVQPEE